MRENRNNQYRPEQLEFAKKLRLERPDSDIDTEYHVIYQYDDEVRHALLDVVDITRKDAFRLNGPIHFSSSKQILKDKIQKAGLEIVGWNVIDIFT